MSENGKIVEECWLGIPLHYENVSIDSAHIVMPNHLHGIIIIEPVGAVTNRPRNRADDIRPYNNTNLSAVVGSFKKAASKLIHAEYTAFDWQKSFYDHVIRKDESLDKIREYIRNNPLKWELDRNNPSNIWM